MPSAQEVDIVNGIFQLVGGWVGTLLILLVVGGLGFGVIYYWVTRSGKPQTDLAGNMVGEIGRAMTRITRTGGRIEVSGEQMRALSARALEAGTAVRIVAIDGLIAKVIPADQEWPPRDLDEPTAVGGPPDFDALSQPEDLSSDES